MAVAVVLWGVAALLCIAVSGVVAQRNSAGSRLIYLSCLLTCSVILVTACGALPAGAKLAESLRLPVGLPWIGAHFTIDALSAFFLVVINLGAAAASLYALGYGEHEERPGRVLPFYPAFLAGMNLVILADDAFSFLFAWEFMSLTSWVLVMAHHDDPDNRRAGYIYIVMASFGTLALLFGVRVARRPSRQLRIRGYARRSTCCLASWSRLGAGVAGGWLQGRSRAVACLAAAGTSGCSEPCLGPHERRHDQSRDLRLHPHHVRSVRWPGLVVGKRGARARQRHGRARCAPRHPAARLEASACLQHG